MKFKILTGLLTGLVVSASISALFCQPSRALLFSLKRVSDADATLKKLPKVDLTVVEFTSNQTYSVAKIGNSDLAAGREAEDFLIQGEEKHKKGDYQGAVAAYNQAIALNPNLAGAYNNRGLARFYLGDKHGAVADFNEALRINPNLAEAYYNRGVVRSGLGDKQGAVADYNEALRINPNLALAYYNRGNARRELGDKQGAIQDLQKAADLFQQQGDKDNYERAINTLRKLQ